MATPAATVDRDNPWPGLASYDEAAQAYFSGRGDETAELVRRIGDEAVTVLFGKSGLGKSSLLKAGVFPALRQRGLLPVPVRLLFGAGAPDAIEQIAAALFAALDAEQIEYPSCSAGETLWDYLHRAGLRFWTLKVRQVQPVLVLDQFEEVFTLGRNAPRVAETLRERLADLAENRIPAALAARVEARDALPEALDVHARPYKLVCSLREDFLPDLEGWVAAMPSLRRNRMRLLPLQRDQALQAVCNARTEHLVDAPLARRIVDYLASGAAAPQGTAGEVDEASVEPALLSLVCRGINEARKRERKPRFDDALFELGKGRIVADFYRESLADQPEALRAFIENELVTDQGYRNSYSVVQAIASERATRAQIATLVGRRLLRIEQHLGAERVELTHDLLASPVLAGRKTRIETRWAQRAQRARRKWAAAFVGMAAAVAVLLVLLRDAQHARDIATAAKTNAEDAQTSLAARNEMLTMQKRSIERSAEEASESASSARKAEARASEAGARALVEAERARAEAARADEASRLARSREVAARAAAVMERDRELAVLLGAEALRIADTPEARGVLLEAALYVWPSTVLAPQQLGGRPRLVGLDASGRHLAVVAQQGEQVRLSLWDLGTRAPKEARWHRVFDRASVGFVVFTPDTGRLLIGRPDSVDQLDVKTGEPAGPPIPMPPSARARPPAQLAVSVDGHWLAAALSSGAALIRDLRDPSGAWETAAADGASGVSVADDGQRIVTVAEGSLRAAVVERDDAGKWVRRPVDLTACVKPRSVATAASYAVATWHAQACSQSLAPGAANEQRLTDDSEAAIADIVTSTFGPAFVAILSNADLKVGTGDPSQPESTTEVKGVRLSTHGNMLSDVSVNGLGTRVAWLRDDGVRIVSLAGYKLLLAEYAGGAIVSVDGRRVVHARAVSRGATLWMTPITAVSEGRELPRSTWRVRLPRLPEKLEVHGDAVVVGVRSAEGQDLATTVYDLDTSAVRPGPFAEAATAAGRDRRLQLVPRDAPARVDEAQVFEGASPSGRLIVRQFRQRDGGKSTVLVRREGDTVVHSFGTRAVDHFLFSDDERWFAFVEGDALQVLDLRTLRPVLTWRAKSLRPVEFTRGGGLLRIERSDDGRALLVPMDRGLLDGFARWLVTRDLTSGERCEHGLDQASCNVASPAAARSEVAKARPR
jgi:hypothetical protein